jgi:hypothetical protein
MAKFIESSVKTYHQDYIGTRYNHPVNIDFCTELIKDNEPNGYGKEYPKIVFKGCGATWYYNENDQKTRDADYDNILNQNS